MIAVVQFDSQENKHMKDTYIWVAKHPTDSDAFEVSFDNEDGNEVKIWSYLKEGFIYVPYKKYKLTEVGE